VGAAAAPRRARGRAGFQSARPYTSGLLHRKMTKV
jgi:hypothetical protein